jgi:hypothetical protein
MSEADPTFTQKETIDKPGIVGARWWQESIANEIPRRKAITGLLALGGALAGVAAIGYIVSRARAAPRTSSGSWFSSEPEYTFQDRSLLDLQKEFGWSFGATGDPLVFDGTSTAPFDRSALERMATDLAPMSALYTPYWIPTLFQSPIAMPKSKPSGDPDAPPFKPLKDVVVPISTPAMKIAFGQGAALAAMLVSNPSKLADLAVVVDLPGPLAVAFAAGMAGKFDPVFLFDNWPHPHGIVPAHLTLAAAIYYQPLFAKVKTGSAKTLRPVFVIDRGRLATYVDSATQFDNRYTAKMPTDGNLDTMGIRNVLYVGPNAVDRFELDDLVDDFVLYSTTGTLFHVCPANAFEQTDTSFFYGGDPTTDKRFWQDWAGDPSARTPNEVQAYTPKPRATAYSSAIPIASVTAHPRPAGFGTIPVAVAVGTGVVLGARASRSGSWNRTTSTSTSS